MSEADRVFARMTTPGTHPASEDTKLIHIAPHRRDAAAGQGRVVEVVHRRSSRTAPPVEPANPPVRSVHAATWPEGFQARTAPTPPPVETPATAATPAPPIGHVMPGWEPLLPPLQPAEPVVTIPAGRRRQPRVTTAKRPDDRPVSARRGFADPFAPEDTGANCIRCGYRVSPARETRGLMTCAQCR